jgi:prevent-host-death family protein
MTLTLDPPSALLDDLEGEVSHWTEPGEGCLTFNIRQTPWYPPPMPRELPSIDIVFVQERLRHQITVRELSRHTAQVLERVDAGETIEVTRNGEPVAVLSPPDVEEATVRGLIKAGILPADWRERQAALRQHLLDNPPPPAEPGQRPLSEILIEMREEETH